ncbi:MAG: aminotransferase class V-fold PLP-dependent enzyme, partial [Desulfobulbaceae bacterium]|nr:aminotransferase class V-fold PLP-dependent enzyme [Desulfobulbaceae bacterium]
MTLKSGRHFLQIPGPSNVPDRILHAIAHPTIDHRGPTFQKLSKEVLLGSRRIFKTSDPVIIFPTSGTGAWEASLMNTLNPGDKILMFETGHFATLWHNMAKKFGLEIDFVP